MVVNTDNAFLRQAVQTLYTQAVKIYPGLSKLSVEDFYRDLVYHEGTLTFRLATVHEDRDKGKLTLEQKTQEGGWTPIQAIVPADCYNLILPGEDLATAVRRVFGTQGTSH